MKCYTSYNLFSWGEMPLIRIAGRSGVASQHLLLPGDLGLRDPKALLRMTWEELSLLQLAEARAWKHTYPSQQLGLQL